MLSCALRAQTSRDAVTPVAGESWLHHLHRSFDETAMGKTGRLGPSAEFSEHMTTVSLAQDPAGMVTLHGADLYRLNCRGCHGESGTGAPPEIGSVVNPVRSTSIPLIVERMRTIGASITRAQAAEMARQSNAALLERIHNGGQDMPAFSHLNDHEVRSLLAYLGVLAGVPGSDADQVTVTESHDRVGELIVKSTCHVCHDAVGDNPDSLQLAAGSIPPLSTLTARVNREHLIRKVTDGAPVIMGSPPMLLRGRMPVFGYLSAFEAGDVYNYLENHPPSVGTGSQNTLQARVISTGSAPPQGPTAGIPRALADVQSRRSPSFKWLVFLSAFTAGVLGIGFVITVREFRNLIAEAELRNRNRLLEFPSANAVAPPSFRRSDAAVVLSQLPDSHALAENREANFH